MPRSNLITMRRLGSLGRWGNQVFEYIFLRTYARRYALDYHCGSWVGQMLMGHSDPPLPENLPTYIERRDDFIIRDEQGKDIGVHPHLGLAYPPDGDEVRGHDMEGYCQFHTSYYAPYRDFIRGLFVPIPSILERMAPAVYCLCAQGVTIIGLHMRRGDTGRFIYYLTPNEWYLQWLKEHWQDYEDPVLFIASENPDDLEVFAEYNPVSSASLLSLSSTAYNVYNYLPSERKYPTPLCMDWFPDWYLLTQCDVLVFGNSTFSYTAGMMNLELQQAWRSRLSTQQFELIDPWNSWPLVREDLRQYSGVPGTAYSGPRHRDGTPKIAAVPNTPRR